MSQAGFIKRVQQCFLIALVCVSAAVGQVATAAEVKPIAVEVVGEPGSTRSLAQHPDSGAADAPSAPPAPIYYSDRGGHWSGIPEDVVIPVVALLVIFGGPVVLVIVLAVLRNRTAARRETVRAETISRYLDAGREVPPELLHGGPIGQKAESNLRKGITNLGLGIGLTIFLVNFLGIGIGSVGFIIIGIGLSQLAIWKLIDSKKVPANTDSDIYRS